MKDRAKSVIMQTDAKARKISEKWTTFSSLPNDILEKILQPLRFKDKCSLELIDKHFNSLLSNPSPVDGLWGRCDLSRDLSLIKRFNMKEDLVRWLTKRLPGFTDLVCDTEHGTFYDPDESGCRLNTNTDAASWLVTQLPNLSSTSKSAFKLHLAINPDVARMLLAPTSAEYISGFQGSFWAAMSKSLTELTILMHPDDEPMRLTELTQLTNLTSLRVWLEHGGPRRPDNAPISHIVGPIPYALSHPGLRSLHMTNFITKDLTLDCPRLRSLTLEHGCVHGRLSLQASLENYAFINETCLDVHEAFPLSNLLGLTRLHCQLPGKMSQETFFGILPTMSALKTLDLFSWDHRLPPRIPAGLQAFKYVLPLRHQPSLCQEELQHFADACQSPEVHNAHLLKYWKWKQDEISALERIKEESKAKVFLADNLMEYDVRFILNEEALPIVANASNPSPCFKWKSYQELQLFSPRELA